MFLRSHPADAGRGAFVDITQEAGPAAGLGPLEHPGAAAADGEDAQERVHGFPDGSGRIGAEVAGALAPVPPHHLDPGQLLAHGQGQVRIGFVVAENDVEAGLEFLDPGVFELQGLQLASHHGPLHAAGRIDHCMGFRQQACRVREIGVQAGAEVFCLADVDDPAMGITEPVHPGVGGNFTRLGPVSCWICHYFILLILSPWPCSGCSWWNVPGR